VSKRETKFKSVKTGRHCPLCEGNDGCSIGDDGLLLCRRREGPQAGFVFLGKSKGDSQYAMFRRESELLKDNHQNHTKANGDKHKVDWEAKAKAFARNLTPELANELAESLALPVGALEELPLLGFANVGPHKDGDGRGLGSCYTFPECDAAGKVIGLNCRYQDCSKKAWPGGRRGLTVPGGWREKPGPIFLPEGPSCTLALNALGVAAVGRPSNTGGVELLAEMLKDVSPERPIIVVGEHDAKTDGSGSWPGRDGATKTADELAAKLGRVASWAMPPDGAKDSRAWSIAKKLPTTGEGIGDDWAAAGERFLSGLTFHDVRPQDAKPAPRFQWDALDSAAFAVADYRPAWLAKKVLVEKQAAVIGGPQKVLKTSVAIDLAVSLAGGTSWLGEFACPAAKRVAILSGESGPFALQSVARRVCAAKEIELAGLGDNLRWLFSLPQLGMADQLAELGEGLERDRVDVAIIDPLYLCLLAGTNGPKAENLYDTGPLLLRVAQACLTAGATPILLHHCTKPSARKTGPLDLGDLAFSGIAEFARQWVLLSRREAYNPDTGQHRLWLVAGGSVGHGGLWALDVDEGQLAEDFTGRTWEVAINTAGAARQQEAGDKEQAKRQREDTARLADGRSVLHTLGVNDPDRCGVSFASLRDASGLSSRRFGAAITALKESGEVEESAGTVSVGNKAKKPARIIRKRLTEGGFMNNRTTVREQPSAVDG
jgi:hypothetical protein